MTNEQFEQMTAQSQYANHQLARILSRLEDHIANGAQACATITDMLADLAVPPTSSERPANHHDIPPDQLHLRITTLENIVNHTLKHRLADIEADLNRLEPRHNELQGHVAHFRNTDATDPADDRLNQIDAEIRSLQQHHARMQHTVHDTLEPRVTGIGVDLNRLRGRHNDLEGRVNTDIKPDLTAVEDGLKLLKANVTAIEGRAALTT